MLNDEHYTPDTTRVAGSDHEDSSGRIQLSTNTRARLEKLARWRIDPGLLKFPKRGPHFEGGYAIVSRALVASSADETTEHVVEPSGRELKSNDRLTRLESDKGDQESEGSNQEASPKNNDGGEEEEEESDLSGRWKAVAVKKMKMKTQDDVVRVLGLTLREAEFLVSLSHENIIGLEGFVEDVSNNVIWLVFPWESHGNLKDFIASADWEIPERISLINDVATGVEYLHEREPPICHGDLKSINILVNSEFRAVITDFGSARHPVSKNPNQESERTNKDPQPAPSLEATHHPSTNTITLTCNHYTLRWAAPELLEDGDATLACDIWALGWVAYEDVKDSMVVIRVVRGDLPSISSDARMLLIQTLCNLMRRCWTAEPKKRPSAKDCRNSIRWIPMISPDPMRTESTTGLVHRSPELLRQLGSIHMRRDDYPTASQYFTKALAIYTDSADSKGKSDALWELAHIHRFQDEYDQAVTLYSECLQIWTDIGDRRGRAAALTGLADVHRLRNEYSQAITFYSECLQIRTDIGDMRGRADALWGLAEVHRLQNKYSQAVTFYSECLQIRTDIGDRQGMANALFGLAELHRRRGEYSQAVAFYSDSLGIRIDIGDRQGRAFTLLGLAEVHRHQKEYSQAMPLFSEALTIFTEIGDRYGRAITLWSMGDVHHDQHDHSSAIHAYEQAAEIYKTIGDPDEATVLERAAN
ncbi:hypothetical protein FS837_001919, partial [Tulasnella sp. UAMH 9824]